MTEGTRTAIILVVDDQPDAVEKMREELEKAGFQTSGATDARETRAVLDDRFVDLMIVDERLGGYSGTKLIRDCRGRYPGLTAILMSGGGDQDMVIAAMRAGAVDFLPKSVGGARVLEAVRLALASNEVARESRYQRWLATRGAELPGLIGSSEATRRLATSIRRVAFSDATVLLCGETGTGKQVVARAIHTLSRRTGLFTELNMGAIQSNLAEATLFGVRKGAFTDAKEDRAGYFEAAQNGTIFLDEIGDATPEIQVRLLKVIDTKSVSRLGETLQRPLNVRIVAATNRDLEAEVKQKHFREDLFYRLNVVTLSLPPLRERASDIPALARHFVDKYSPALRRGVTGLDEGAIEKLRSYSWPGNVRQLEHAIQRAILNAEGEVIVPFDIELGPATSIAAFGEVLDQPYPEAKRALKRAYFARLMDRAHGNKSRAAELAKLDRGGIYDHLKETR